MKYIVQKTIRNTDLTEGRIVETSDNGFLYCKGYLYPFEEPGRVKILPSEVRVMVSMGVLKPTKKEVPQEWDHIKVRMEFIECDICRPKPGSPTLCASCLHNRTVIDRLRELALL